MKNLIDFSFNVLLSCYNLDNENLFLSKLNEKIIFSLNNFEQQKININLSENQISAITMYKHKLLFGFWNKLNQLTIYENLNNEQSVSIINLPSNSIINSLLVKIES